MVVLRLVGSAECVEDTVCLPFEVPGTRSTDSQCSTVNHDDFMSRYLLLKNGRKEVLSRI